ncbi:hypothetical protein [Paenibacillus sp. NFR01]|uniref:hypothetical protein n=1 Tax=Paenibacillus sp. NFR01 TaxID=1566279 RepID=UPI0008C431E8|nr:hypothetical protein [Paenibacillus sp. NFR01]SET95025.1 hypothetical protein SAMN03159358_2827 [Paenibacillus sp. NFR01]
MDYIVKLAFVLLIFIYTWLFQVQNQEWDLNRSLLKDANNAAVHDAAQAINLSEYAKGRIVIDPIAARSAFDKGLEINLGLDEGLNFKKGSPLHAKVEVVDFIIVDESTNSFPLLYENKLYGITKYLRGPAVIAVIKTKHTVLIARNKSPEDIEVPAVQENKLVYK